jgi:hypothetical protein
MNTPLPSPVFASFREAFCHRFRCPSENFRRRAFFKAVPWWRLPLVLPAYWLAPATFGMDFDILGILGKTRSKAEFSQQLDEFHNALRAGRQWEKKWLGLRMSGEQLTDLRDELDPLIDPRPSPAELAPARGAAAPRSESVAARAPGESRSLTARKLRQAAEAVMSGVPVGNAVAVAGFTEAEFLDRLEAEAGQTPSFGWLREQLLRIRRLETAEMELARLNQMVAEQERELSQLREQLARPGVPG